MHSAREKSDLLCVIQNSFTACWYCFSSKPFISVIDKINSLSFHRKELAENRF